MRTQRLLVAAFLTLPTGTAMADTPIEIRSEWGTVEASLGDNASARALSAMLPITIQMRDHMRQEKTGNLPKGLPDTKRQQDFSKGTLGLWGSDDFVIYYRGGRVPRPGIVILGSVSGDVSIFDRPGPVSVEIRSHSPAERPSDRGQERKTP
ncbi:hypothetical protein EON82_25085 [bacterium]|nr:MAG: hypothetical protein EON82_25085 [bacterium]